MISFYHDFFKSSKFHLLSAFSSGVLFLVVTLLSIFSTNAAYCFDLTLGWSKNTEPNLAGYYIYYKNGSSGAPYDGTGSAEGDSPIKIPLSSLNDPDNPEKTIHGLIGTGTFYLSATAYDIYGNESDYSTEVSYQPSAPVANDDSASIAENSGANIIRVINNDSFGSEGPAAAGIRITTPPNNGTASVNNCNTSNDPTDDSIDYTPYPDFTGTDTLTYEICDSNNDCDTALLTITVMQEPKSGSIDIKANGSDDPIYLNSGETLSITIELDPGDYPGVQADWWCAADTPFGWYYFNNGTKIWLPGVKVSYQGPLENVSPSLEVLNMSDLPAGSYTFYFGVDGKRNGNLDESYLYYDSVDVTVAP